MITLNGRTKLTTETEKLLVELAGENPLRTLTQEDLARATLKGLAAMARQGRTRTLEKLYLSYRRDHPSLPSLEQLRERDCPSPPTARLDVTSNRNESIYTA